MLVKGALTALVTPFRDGRVDVEALRALVERQIERGIHGLVPCGTTGESPSLTIDEHGLVVRTVVEAVRRRVPVVAGAGSNSTRHAIELTRSCRDAGADAVLHVMPYYNKPTQDGLVAHFTAILREVPMPTMLYNVPPRTATDLLPETVARVAHALPDVFAIKEASGSVLRAQKILELLGDRLAVFSGDDAMTLAVLAVGGSGVVSVTSNVDPAAVAGVCTRWFEGRTEEARQAHFDLLALHEVLFIETSPGPVKAALALRGEIPSEIRLPLVWPSASSVERIRAVLARRQPGSPA
ncbi:MAG: 4-hydroxy-tetrahydrodipicolinate synthase [Deltaproteobacteria bacterium]|nr:4-hydroxy-tetrahydrodipicolinate synthase [Deltaproteobacteria bacterium]